MSDKEQEIREAWQANASAWSRAVRTGAIGSRGRVTDVAVIHEVREFRPQSILDLGCGEGWLCRALKAEGIQTVGVDLIPALGGNRSIRDYQRAGNGQNRSIG